jgi:hypothetical protein
VKEQHNELKKEHVNFTEEQKGASEQTLQGMREEK